MFDKCAFAMLVLVALSCEDTSSHAGSHAPEGGTAGSRGNAPDTGQETGLDGAQESTPDSISGEASSTDQGANTCPGRPPPALKLSAVLKNLKFALFLTSDPSDAGRLFIALRDGKVLLLKAGQESATAFLDITSRVSMEGEGGLLGMAFHPSYGRGQNRRFWVHYTDLKLDNVIEEYETSATNPDTANPTPRKSLFTLDQQQYRNHKGGSIAFGPDGYLYVALGDGGNGTRSRDPASKFGKILRIDVDNYPLPVPANLPEPGADPHVLHYGLRNPWRMSFDRVRGDLYIGDVGEAGWEEIDVAGRADSRHVNFGFPTMEGAYCYVSSSCNQAGLTTPIDAYPHTHPLQAVSAGYVYRGSRIPGLVGRYIYADFYTARFWTLVWNGTGMCDKYEVTQDLNPTTSLTQVSFGEDASGEVYVINYHDTAGAVYRIDPK